ncbi:receptor-type tyrosine-protein phosphatase kappa [Octopus bimaculoides]|uniref:receptor-type tyrosine-protein phosphatase kappa n=1 Tax=Octopus bimaculoides TaxID=37653 RepID=UPI0022E1B1C3|nr:receptor-type tyrosine-protein phosphatase kappa [Octopus bimaculoides]
MVWQEQVRCIVMATGLFEHATQQCDKYWEDIVNDYGQVKHGKITIRTINTVSIAHLTIRTLQICKEGDPGCRIIEHFEMSSWEMDDTIDAGVILDSRRRILKYMDSSSGPLLVHCRI